MGALYGLLELTWWLTKPYLELLYTRTFILFFTASHVTYLSKYLVGIKEKQQVYFS